MKPIAVIIVAILSNITHLFIKYKDNIIICPNQIFYYLCRMILDLTKYSIEDLVSLKNEINNHLHFYVDGYLYICNVRSYGRQWKQNVNNLHSLQELCNQYDGYDGIVDIYSTNPNLSEIENYGNVMYIVSEEDYEKWKQYDYLTSTVSDINHKLDVWESREQMSFRDRPTFAPYYNREELAGLEKEIVEYDMSFVAPVSVKRVYEE